MATSFQLSVVAPDRSVVEGVVHSVIAPGAEGYFGVLKNHVPLVASLKAGLLEYETESHDRHYVAVKGGFFEMAGDKATVLADAAEPAPEIDVKRAEHDLEMARATLRGEETEMSTDQAVIELEYAIVRLKAAEIANGSNRS